MRMREEKNRMMIGRVSEGSGKFFKILEEIGD